MRREVFEVREKRTQFFKGMKRPSLRQEMADKSRLARNQGHCLARACISSMPRPLDKIRVHREHGVPFFYLRLSLHHGMSKNLKKRDTPRAAKLKEFIERNRRNPQKIQMEHLRKPRGIARLRHGVENKEKLPELPVLQN